MTRRQATSLALTWTVATAVLLAADDIAVTPLVTDERRVFASFEASSTFSEDEEAVMRSGLLLTFTYTIEVRRPSTLWFDATLGQTVVSATVTHDNLTGDYQVSKSQEGQVVWSETTADETQARTWMTTFEKRPVALSEPLEPNEDYYLQVRLRKNPRSRFSLWPWGRDDGSGRASFPFIR